MPRKLVVCLDGTWNDPNTGTNVYRLKNRIRPRGQVVYYDAGVGSARVRVSRQKWMKNLLDRIGGRRVRRGPLRQCAGGLPLDRRALRGRR